MHICLNGLFDFWLAPQAAVLLFQLAFAALEQARRRRK